MIAADGAMRRTAVQLYYTSNLKLRMALHVGNPTWTLGAIGNVAGMTS